MALHSQKILQDLSKFMLKKYCRYCLATGGPQSAPSSQVPVPRLLPGCAISLGADPTGRSASFPTDTQVVLDFGVKLEASASFCCITEVGFSA